MIVSSTEKASIIVVEDETIVALDIKRRLEKLGYRIIGLASTADQCLGLVEKTKPNLVLMDISLTGSMDGIEAAEILHKRFLIPVIFLTANSDKSTLQRASLAEAYGYILKPFSERELASTIEMALYRNGMEQKLRESENRLRAIFEAASDGLFLISQDGEILDVNPAGCNMFGYERSELLHASVRKMAFELLDQSMPAMRSDLNGDGLHEYQMRHKDGSTVWVEMTLSKVEGGVNSPVIGIVRDITRRKEAELQLRKSEERYSLALRGANDGLWDLDLKTESMYFSPRWKEMLGYAEEDIEDTMSAWLSLIYVEDLDLFEIQLSNHLSGRTLQFEVEHRMRTKNDNYRWVQTRGLALRDEQGNVYRMSGSQTDVTERKLAERQLLHDAFHDELTGLPNRALFSDRLGRALERVQRNSGRQFAVIFMDLDRFKIVNDSLGHQAGDQLLVQLSRRLSNVLRSMDTLARLSGDEFVVLLEEITELPEVISVVERIQEELKHSYILNNQTVFISASMGIVADVHMYHKPEDVLRDADIAMYRAKMEGKNRYVVFDDQLRSQALTRLELEADLRGALERNELVICYQPILDLNTYRLTGFEALLRWEHPKRGEIMPINFITLAEETGLILQIGWWVLDEACQKLKGWQNLLQCEPPLSMSVNLSGRQLVHPDLQNQITRILAQNQVDPHNLKLEITETQLVENSSVTIRAMGFLRNLGIQLLIDDFGMGFSSLGYVQHFPIDTIKIDRSFIHQIDAENQYPEVAHMIINLAHELGMGTIAEGIETEEQLEQLKMLNCAHGQGFLFSKALDHEHVQKLLNLLANSNNSLRQILESFSSENGSILRD